MNKIQQLRKEKGFSQSELAKKAGISEISIRKYESGDRKPKIETLRKIAAAMDVSVSELNPDACFDVSKISKRITDIFVGDIDTLITEQLNNDNELFLLEKYRSLNSTGKEEARKRVAELTEIKKYTEREKPKLKAVFKNSQKETD